MPNIHLFGNITKDNHSVNVVIQNSTITELLDSSGETLERLIAPFFWTNDSGFENPNQNEGEDVFIMPEGTTLIDLLVLMGIFTSKSQAKKNWKGVIEIPSGFSHFSKLGKLNKTLTILCVAKVQ